MGEQKQCLAGGEEPDERPRSVSASLTRLDLEFAVLRTWSPEAAATFPQVPWGPSDLLKVMGSCLVAAALFAAANGALLQAAPDAPASAQASLHLAREGLLAFLLPAAVLASLAGLKPWERGLLQARWEPEWALRTLAVCCAVFPLADPLLYHAWEPVARAVFGPAPASALVGQVQEAAAAGDWQSLGEHVVASGLVGPIWEEVFWRGFFLASLTKVLPLPVCVAASSLNFAALHWSPCNFAPLLLLSATCDALYLRTHNLMAPLLLHCLWNSGQLLAIAFLGKAEFV